MNGATDTTGTAMTDAAADTPEVPGKSRKLTYVLWLLLALAGAGGGFYAVYAGLIPAPGGDSHADSHSSDPGSQTATPDDTVFVAIEPIMISLAGGSGEHLRFRAELEVAPDQVAEVTRIMPRIVDVLNSYLRALENRDLRDPMALTRLRGQMLRRVSIVAGPGRVRDLLIMEFVLN
jgi:flagellar FliL protein